MSDRAKFIIIAASLIGLLALIEIFYPKPVSWEISLSSEDTIPFGASALEESLADIFPDEEINLSRESFYLMDDTLDYSNGYLIISQSLSQGKEDFEAMMKKISEGAYVLVSSYEFNRFFQDSLGITVNDDIIDDLYPKGLIPEQDSSFLEMVFPNLDKKFGYRRMDAPYSFTMDDENRWETLMVNEEGKPVSIAGDFGVGRLILNCTPLVFSNYYMLYTENSKPAAALLSQLPLTPLHWTEFYNRGRGEPQTPLRYILSTAPLKWSYYLTIIAILAFVFFEAKRKQRPVPVIYPLKNDSLDFIKTVGNLYYENGDHKNIADKKIHYLLEFIRTHYHMSTTEVFNSEFQNQLAQKSGKPVMNVEGLFTMIGILQNKQSIHEDELRILNGKIEAFLKP